jgi:hypothetical protein
MIKLALRYMGTALTLLAWVGFGAGYYLAAPPYEETIVISIPSTVKEGSQ